MVGKDWCLGFCRRNGLSLRKLEGLSTARAAGVNKGAVSSYLELLGNWASFKQSATKNNSIERGEKVISLTSVERGEKVISLTSVERGENHAATPLDHTSRQWSFLREYASVRNSLIITLTDHLSARESGINEDIFLKFLEHFREHRVPGRVLLILDGYSSQAAL
ncbi:hypothetical protein PR048_018028 [Dryococelus australis]|uniref:Transposase n=1 Tax=Dryococelus australis TaxID=614101 RepID=A0ABQ9HBA3_9NEOP|nr:hypothetical protein PR048_018028 [Dryococelus australis]